MTTLFSSFETLVFWLVLLSVYASLAVVVGNGVGDAIKVRGKRRKEISPFLLILVLGAAIAIGYARIGVLPAWLFYPGEILFVLGYGLTIYSIFLLGRYYSTYVEVLPQHKIIEKGPYRIIRHPNYLGQMVGVIGIGLALQSWAALLVLLIIGAGYFAYRIRNEERFLVNEIGENYSDYVKRTKRLIPSVY